MVEYFTALETTKDYPGYTYSVGETLTIVILGMFCGLRNVSQIHQWSSSEHIRSFLREHFGIIKIPCYYWMLCLLKIIQPDSFNQCFSKRVNSVIPESITGLTLSFDGKTVRSTSKMKGYPNALHIVSAQLSAFGITIGHQAVYDKSNEIPAVQKLIKSLYINGCMVVADALNCQKATAQAIADGKADYILDVKDNQETLKEDIETYVQDAGLRKGMATAYTLDKSRERVELRSAFITNGAGWLYGKENWAKLTTIGAINRKVTTLAGESNEWHYYICGKKLTAEQFLKHVRSEWAAESMRWLLDVRFSEDYCRVEDKNVQKNLNAIRKVVLNTVKTFKSKHKDDELGKRPISKILMDCMLDSNMILNLLERTQN